MDNSLAGLNVTDKDLEAVMPIKTLTLLDLSSTMITDKSVLDLEKMPNLKTLVLNNCDHVSIAAIKRAAKRFTVEAAQAKGAIGTPDLQEMFDSMPDYGKE